VFVITHQKTLGLLLNDLFKNRAMTYVVGAILTLGGALIIFSETTSDWLGIFVQIMGWAILVKGGLYILAPERLHKMVKPWTRSTLLLMGVTVTAAGAYLVFFLG
jgi:hypothetical protein